MSRRHIATHAYDFRRGWVRVPPTQITPERAMKLRDEGFTIVRSRRGWFGARELPVTWYIPRSDAGLSGIDEPADSSAEVQSAKLRERVDHPTDAAPAATVPDPAVPPTRRDRQRSDDRDR